MGVIIPYSILKVPSDSASSCIGRGGVEPPSIPFGINQPFYPVKLPTYEFKGYTGIGSRNVLTYPIYP